MVEDVPFSVSEGLLIRIERIRLAENDREKRIFDILNRAWIATDVKELIFREWQEAENEQQFRSRLAGLDVQEELKEMIREVFR